MHFVLIQRAVSIGLGVECLKFCVQWIIWRNHCRRWPTCRCPLYLSIGPRCALINTFLTSCSLCLEIKRSNSYKSNITLKEFSCFSAFWVNRIICIHFIHTAQVVLSDHLKNFLIIRISSIWLFTCPCICYARIKIGIPQKGFTISHSSCYFATAYFCTVRLIRHSNCNSCTCALACSTAFHFLTWTWISSCCLVESHYKFAFFHGWFPHI